jgi:prephenate dehydratase
MRVAIQGEAGAFSHAAALALHGPDLRLLSCPTFDELFRAVQSGEAARGMVPIENSLAGSVYENYDLLSAHALHVVAEWYLRIRHCLIARPGTTLADIRRVASHPVALAQCRRFFQSHPEIVATPAYDTAGSVRNLMAGDTAADAAIASGLAAQLYGAAVLADGLEDHAENYTRFLVIAREPAPAERANKTSLLFGLSNAPGTLHRALGVFASRGLDLSKIESRPVPGRPWEYLFYLDVLGRPEEVGRAVEELRAFAPGLRILGAYAGATAVTTPPAVSPTGAASGRRSPPA